MLLQCKTLIPFKALHRIHFSRERRDLQRIFYVTYLREMLPNWRYVATVLFFVPRLKNIESTSLIQCLKFFGKKLILTRWKKRDAPSLKLWLNDLANTLHVEQIWDTLSDRLSSFSKIWAPLHFCSYNHVIVFWLFIMTKLAGTGVVGAWEGIVSY